MTSPAYDPKIKAHADRRPDQVSAKYWAGAGQLSVAHHDLGAMICWRLIDQSELNPMDEGAAILAIGDVHLGTACSGVPDEISSWGLDPSELTPTAALKHSVKFAIHIIFQITSMKLKSFNFFHMLTNIWLDLMLKLSMQMKPLN